MSTLSIDYTGCSILIYTEEGEHLCSTSIKSYDRQMLRIEVQNHLTSLNAGDNCKLLILSSPTPCEYRGRLIKEGTKKFILMHDGQTREMRRVERYEINIPAQILDLVCDGLYYTLHTPIEVELMNISKAGVRFSAPYFSLMAGDIFRMSMKIGNNNKLLIAEVTNNLDKGTSKSEYGCRLLLSSEEGF